MSNIGRQPISIPQGVSVEVTNGRVKVSGSRGTLERALPMEVEVTQEGNLVKVKSKSSALWGTWRAHIANMVKGVSEGFTKILEIHGVGYRVALQGEKLTFQLGFSHLVVVEIPEGVECEVKENTVVVSGIDKERVGQFAATLRSLKPPDPYKGKGIRYRGEVVKLKPGKRAGALTS